MPVLFFIDPEFQEDPRMQDVDCITLSYTFYRTSDVSFEDSHPNPGHTFRPGI